MSDTDENAKIKWRNYKHEERLKLDKQLEKEMSESQASVPSNEEIISLIPSKATREYLKKIGHVFSERDREILRRYLKPKNDDEFNSVYEAGRYVSIPHPFRRGDIVVLTHCSPKSDSYEIGIMRSFSDDDAWNDWDKDVQTRLKDITDFSDVATTVEFLQDSGSFSHNHPNPMELEFACDIQGMLSENPLRALYLKAASNLIKGEGSIELYEMYKESYTSSPEHLIELLEKLNQCLCEYNRSFDSVMKLDFPNDFDEIHELSKKEDEDSYFNEMHINSWRISCYIKNIELPFSTLVEKSKHGTFHEEITDAQRKSVAELLESIFTEEKHILLQIENFAKTPDCQCKMFYQKNISAKIRKLKSFTQKYFKDEKFSF